MANEKAKETKVDKPEKTKKVDKPASGKGKKSSGKAGSQQQVVLAAPGETFVSPSKTPRLLERYRNVAIPALMKEFQYGNSMQVPRLSKIVVNCAVKEAVSNPKVLDSALSDIMALTGQKPVMTRARKSIATFKVRTGLPLAVMVTLRRARMYEFLDRVINIALPRVRDFKGVNPKSFDGRGNYSLGLREQIIFPEIDYDKVDGIRGMTVTICTTAQSNQHARALLAELGMPFRT